MTTCTPRAAWGNLLRRLHFYVGLFVGPFIFFAALTGTLYVATPQLENALYRHALHTVPWASRSRWRNKLPWRKKRLDQICVYTPFVRAD
jgi:uncharacterized iron-regulated membrane protein